MHTALFYSALNANNLELNNEYIYQIFYILKLIQYTYQNLQNSNRFFSKKFLKAAFKEIP